jgi:AraC-like DNA-binding protein
MKVLPFKIPKTQAVSLIFQEDREFIFYDKLHQHAEIQISYIQQGDGSVLVGDAITTYETGDIIVLGSNLPHVFRSDRDAEGKMSIMQTIFFTKETFGKTFFELPELRKLDAFFELIQHGILIRNNTKGIIQHFEEFKTAEEYDRLLTFLALLKTLHLAEKRGLSNFVYDKPFTDLEGKRMQSVFEYVMINYQKNITLLDIAEVANMTKNAFCKYFKTRTNKTFFQFLIEIRVESAAKMLIKNPEFSVMEVAEFCGFNNMSNFNRQFKEIKGQTPLVIRSLRKVG